MSFWQFLFIVGAAAVGFLGVSLVFEVRSNSKDAARQARDNTDQPEPNKGRAETIKWFDVLGVTPNASIEEIKTAYHEKVRQYHPDRVADLGEELRRMAEHGMKELNAAYELALKNR